MTPSNFRSPLSGERKYFFCIALSAGEKGITELCPFCPYEMRSMSRKGRELCPIGAKREGKPRFSGAALRAHAVVSPLNLSASPSLYFFCEKMQRNPALCLPFLTKGRCHGVTEGIRKSAFDTANRNAGNQSAKRASLVMHFLPIRNAEHEQERKGTLPHRGKEGGKTAI